VFKDACAGQLLPASMLGAVHMADLTAPEERVLGCLIEKRFTTPDQYPLSLNALRLACNQSTNRDPVTDYDESTIRDAAQRLSRYGLARLASAHGSRAIKYRHLAEDALGLERRELAVLAVLLLRGPQTPGELRSRTARMAELSSPSDAEQVLDVLIERGYAVRLTRRPGQKEERFKHTLGEDAPADSPGAAAPTADERAGASPDADNSDLYERLRRLEEEVAELRTELRGITRTREPHRDRPPHLDRPPRLDREGDLDREPELAREPHRAREDW
jgi:uncharacterized protein YceH (UPF0502 family)